MAGDTSLIEVIEANAASDAPIHQAYRQALEQEPVEPCNEQTLDNSLKRKREELELRRMEIQTYKELCTDTTMDEKARQVFKDAILSSYLPKSDLDLSDALEAEPKGDDPLSSKFVVPKDHFVLENMRKAFVICKDPSSSFIAEDILYDAFMKSIPWADHVRNLEAMFSICNPGKRLTMYFIKLYQEKKRRVCQDNFAFCLEMIGGEYGVHRRRRFWKNVVPRCV